MSSELEEAEVLSEGERRLADGRKIIIREVRPPENKEMLPVEAFTDLVSNTPEFAADRLAWIESQQELQCHKVQMFSCTVYDRKVTQVRWTHQGEPYLAYTNADFNYLRGIMSVVTETDRFDYLFGIGNESTETTRDKLPSLPDFSSERSEYALLKGDPTNTAATAGFAALLVHYDANLDSLKIAYQRSKALTAAQKRYDARHPKQPEDFIMQFWVPEKKGMK